MNEANPADARGYEELQRTGGKAVLDGVVGVVAQQAFDVLLPSDPTGPGGQDGVVALGVSQVRTSRNAG